MSDAAASARSSTRPPRLAVLWDSLSGYHYACLEALRARGAELLVYQRSSRTDAPFDHAALQGDIVSTVWTDAPDESALDAALDEFDPDAVLVCSWHIGPYRRAARRLRGRTLRVVSVHNQWFGSLKQLGGWALSPWVLRPAYDAAFVSGDRQAEFAAKLGFPADRLLWGVNTCDHARFSAVADARGDDVPPTAFVFVGRLVPDKAIDVLVAAFRDYRRQVTEPWPLLVVGTGPQDEVLRDQPGVEMLGFVQPGQLPDVYARAGCLVLPSRFEPWGIAIHEATAAGLPVVCSRECGASARLVLDGYNGAVVAANDPEALTRGLLRVHQAGDRERRDMGAASRLLAEQFTPERWATTLLSRVPELRIQAGLSPVPWPESDSQGRMRPTPG